jgi:hypothetical protein
VLASLLVVAVLLNLFLILPFLFASLDEDFFFLSGHANKMMLETIGNGKV